MQTKWDAKSIFFHPLHSKPKIVDKFNGISEKRLSLFSLFKKIIGEKENAKFVFHAQSSLPYLIPVFLFSVLLNSKNHTFVYDVHDLHERSNFKKVLDKIRYDIIRYRILGLMEWFVFKFKKVNKITVSKGLSSILAKRYNSPPPSLVYNISVNIPRKGKDKKIAKKYSDEDLLFFGTNKRVPLSLIPDIYKENLRLHMYGYNITSEWLDDKIGTPDKYCVKLHGGYLPDEMKFLSRYKILLLYSPDSTSINFKISMPNKIFQALYSGLSVIISENFKEIEHTFSDIPGAVIVHDKEKNIKQTINELKAERYGNYQEKILSKLDGIIEDSKQNYLLDNY